MTKTELKLYEKSEKAGFISSQLYETIHEIFYDPEGGTDEDIVAMVEILGLVKQAYKIATKVEKRLHG